MDKLERPLGPLEAAQQLLSQVAEVRPVRQGPARERGRRLGQQDLPAVAEEIRRRLKEEQAQRGEFARVYAAPGSSGDVPDEPETRLVILGPDHPHAGRTPDSAARRAAAQLLDQRGTGPRTYRNALVFLAPDKARLTELEQAVRQLLAWQSIERGRETLNLDAFQANQARTKREQADETVRQRIPEAYAWLLVPAQPDPTGSVEWDERRLQGNDRLAVRASRRLVNDGDLITTYGATVLRLQLDRIPLWRGDHVGVKQLRDDFATYLYLPRLKDADVLLAAIRDGVGSLTWETEGFAYAESFDIATSRYLGLRAGETGSVVLNNDSVVVKPEAARRQLDADDAARREREGGRLSVREGAVDYVEHPGGVTSVGPSPHPGDGHRPVGPRPTVLRRFHGAATLDPLRVSTQSQQIAEAVVQHLAGLVGARVRITLEIEADLPDGAPDHVVRTVTENCRALRFSDAGFEES